MSFTMQPLKPLLFFILKIAATLAIWSDWKKLLGIAFENIFFQTYKRYN